MSLPTISDGKTGTREFALCNTLFWVFITCWQYFVRSPQEAEADYKMWEYMTGATWLFNSGAFLGKMAANVWERQRPGNARRQHSELGDSA